METARALAAPTSASAWAPRWYIALVSVLVLRLRDHSCLRPAHCSCLELRFSASQPVTW